MRPGQVERERERRERGGGGEDILRSVGEVDMSRIWTKEAGGRMRREEDGSRDVIDSRGWSYRVNPPT